jgi:hypothetical protein
MTTKIRKRVRAGLKFHSVYADSNAQWEVIRQDGPNTWICTITQDDLDYAGVTRAFLSREILGSVNQAARLHSYFDAADAWFDALELGSTVHYCDGFRKMIRCEVVIGTNENVGGLDPHELIGRKILQPVALVGNWHRNDLPRRNYKGEIQHGYHAAKILNGNGAWRPSTSCIWEAPDCSPRYRTDTPSPLRLAPLDLTLPEPDAETLERERLYRLLDEIAKVAGTTQDDPREILATVQDLIAKAGG